ncbi:12736_t:CDS:2, partial [Gigaspora margarita]
CCVHLGFDIMQRSDIELAIEGIHETSVAQLEPEHTKGKKKPCNGEYAGYVRACTILNIGKWNDFLLAKLEKLKKNTKTESSSFSTYDPQISVVYPITLDNIAEEMQKELIELMKIGSLEKSDVPKVPTIQNWIARYATQHKQKMGQMKIYNNN